MSGGSFDYVYHDVNDPEYIYRAIPKLVEVEKFLRDKQKHDAADEILKYRLNLETHFSVMVAIGERLQDVLQAAEWWASGDWGEGHFDNRWNTLLGMTEENK